MATNHIYAPVASEINTNITDFYAFQSENIGTLFLLNILDPLSLSASETASLDENVNDYKVEDLEFLAISREIKTCFFVPFVPSSIGINGNINEIVSKNEVVITSYGISATIAESNGMIMFSGSRDDPFFINFA